MSEIPDLLVALNDAKAEIERLRAELAEQRARTIRVTSDNEQVERDTAERIAGYVAMETGQDQLAADIRAGSWRRT